MVLVHGLGMGQQSFGMLRAQLSRSFDVVALDLPGFGQSPEPATSLPMVELADLVAAALASLVQTPAILVGHSMGAQIVAEVAARHPALVERVAFVSPTVNPAERSAWQQGLRMVQDLRNDPPIVIAVGARLYLRAGPRWYLRKLRTMLEHDLRTPLPHIAQPALVIRGDQDRVCPPDWAHEVVDALPDGALRTIEDCGHESIVTGADRLAAILEEFVG